MSDILPINVDWNAAGKPPDIVGNYVNAFQVGQSLAKNAATQNAANAFATNPQAGITAATRIDPALGAQWQGINQANQDRQTNLTVAPMLASGNTAGAIQAEGVAGHSDQVMALQKLAREAPMQQVAAASQTHEIIANYLSGMTRSVPMPPNADPATAQQVIQQRRALAVQHAQAEGFPASFVQTVGQQDFSDEGIAGLVQSNLSAKDQMDAALRDRTLTETARHDRADEGKPQYVETKNADGSTRQDLVNGPQVSAALGGSVGGAGSGGGGGLSAPALGGQVGQQVAAMASRMNATPAETTYLNQLAMKESHGNPSARNGSSTGLFQLHPDTFAAAGGGNINDVGDQTKAALTLARQNQPALSQVLGRAPTPGELYLAHQQGLGGAKALLAAGDSAGAVAALTPLYAARYGDQAARVARQAVINNGGSPDMTAGQFARHVQSYFNGGGGGAVASAAPAGGGSIGGPGGVPTSLSGSGEGGDAAGAANPQNLMGADYLKTLPGNEQAIVRALDSGRMALPSSFALTKPYWQDILQKVANYDPRFDAAKYPVTQSTKNALAHGKLGDTFAAIGQGIPHLDLLDKASADLHNSDFKPLNAFTHMVAPIAGSAGIPTTQAVNRFHANADPAIGEQVRIFRGAGGAEADITRALTQYSDANPHAVNHAAISKIADLYSERLASSAQEANNGLARPQDPLSFLTPHAAEALYRLTSQDGKDVFGPDVNSAAQAAAKASFFRGSAQNGHTPVEAEAGWKAYNASHFDLQGNFRGPGGARSASSVPQRGQSSQPAAQRPPGRVAPTGAGHLTDAQLRAQLGL